MVADTYSDTLGYLVMGTGNDNNVWGGFANSAVFQIFEDAIANALTSSVTGGTLDLSGSPPPAAASQARYAALIFSGVLASNQVVQVPNLEKFWFVKNGTSGSFTLKIKTPSGSASTAIPQNSGWQIVYCDGADGIVVHPFNTAQIQMPDGSAAAPAYSNVNEPDSGWRRAGTEDWRFVIDGDDVLQITGAGASSPSIFNILSPQQLQLAGASVIPIGAEIDCGAIELPSGWLWKNGAQQSRSTYALLFAALTKTCTGDTASGSPTISNVSADLRSKGLEGATIEGSGIPTGTTVTAITATSFTMSANATGNGTGVSLRLLPYGQGDGSTTFHLPDDRERTSFGRADMGGVGDPGRITSAVAGVSPLNLSSSFGAQTVTLAQSTLPNVSVSISLVDPGHLHAMSGSYVFPSGGSVGLGGGALAFGYGSNTNTAVTNISATASSINGGVAQTAVNKLPPARITNKIIFSGVF